MPLRAEEINMSNQPLIIGWRETASLPDWGIQSIATKVDTGARTSAIHVNNIEMLPNDRVRFDVVVRLAKPGRSLKVVSVETGVVRVSVVRPSTGQRQERLVVSTRVRLGPIEREVELSLVSRHRMLCRLLLGRRALDGAFLIDPTHRALLKPLKSRRGTGGAS